MLNEECKGCARAGLADDGGGYPKDVEADGEPPYRLDENLDGRPLLLSASPANRFLELAAFGVSSGGVNALLLAIDV